MLLPASYIRFGHKIYVELDCRNKAERTVEKMHLLASEIEKYLSKQFNLTETFKVRILKYDDDHAYGIN